MGWFVRNLRDLKWWNRGPRGFVADLHGDDDAQVGVNLMVLGPGRPMLAGVSHTIVGVGDGPSAILAIGGREHQDGPDWGGYPYSEVAMHHNASAEEETDPDVRYARFLERREGEFDEAWLS